MPDFETTLSRYADLIVQIGLNLQSGQRLIIQSPVEAAPLARLVAASAYRAGCRYVDVFFSDDQITLARFKNAPRDSFEEFPPYRGPAMLEHAQKGGAFLSLAATDPDLLKGQDPELIGLSMKTTRKHMQPLSLLLSRNAANWCVVSMPIPSWAAKVFPGLPAEVQVERLWQAIFQVCRLDQPDPVGLWKQHIAGLGARAAALTARAYHALHLRAPGTDLVVGLPAGHIWAGGSSNCQAGFEFVPNMPTEEVFTLPHRARVDGVVKATMPLNYGGTLIEDLSLTFKDGVVVDFSAAIGQDVLGTLLDTDEGSRRLGEVALVPAGSPVASTGLLFYNTLFDENAASHLALGRAYEFTLGGSEKMSPEEYAAAGANSSLAHVDFMIGSDKMEVDGLGADGSRTPLMRKGEWVERA